MENDWIARLFAWTIGVFTLYGTYRVYSTGIIAYAGKVHTMGDVGRIIMTIFTFCLALYFFYLGLFLDDKD